MNRAEMGMNSVTTFRPFSRRVVPVSTADYYANAAGPIAPRPEHSALDLSKLDATGFAPADWHEELDVYMDELLAE